MEDDGGGVFVTMAKVVLMLINMLFLVVGCLLVFFSHRVKTSGWLDALDGGYTWIGQSSVIFLLVLGVIVILLSMVGCFGAWLKNRCLLTIYVIVLILSLIFFAVVTFGASTAKSMASTWSNKDFPAESRETEVATNFNKLYCYAQVPYYCNNARINDVLSMFNLSIPGYFSAQSTNVTSLCNVVKSKEVDTICSICTSKEVQKYASYEPVLDWTQSQCPRNAGNQLWCGNFLLTNQEGKTFGDHSPYSDCRPAFFSFITKWTNLVFLGSLVLCFALAGVLIFACVVRRNAKTARESRRYDQQQHMYPNA